VCERERERKRGEKERLTDRQIEGGGGGGCGCGNVTAYKAKCTRSTKAEPKINSGRFEI
jgi:hypothetical protein